MNKEKYGVHIAHCCYIHGCKYGDEDCPVVSGEVAQKYPCYDCDEGTEPYTLEEIELLRKTKSYRPTNKEMKQQIADLEAKLAEKDKEIETLKAKLETAEYWNKKYDDCQQQLAEKEKEIERLKTNYVGGMQNANEATRIFKEEYYKANQSKTEFAIEKLQRVKENCQAFDGIELVGFIDQIIKELEGKVKKIKFVLNGCDISFIAEAPEDITLKQLLKQCDKIKPDWCACGIRSVNEEDYPAEAEIIIDYDSVKKSSEDVSCRIIEGETK